MRRFLSILAFSLLMIGSVVAQGNGNGCGNGNGSYGNNGNGNNPWANINAPQWLMNWVQNGGQVPMPLAVMVINEARPWGQQNFGLNQGQMIVKYLQGQLTIEFVSTSPPSLTFRVRFGGGDIMVVIADL